jgi:hypothetical protein
MLILKLPSFRSQERCSRISSLRNDDGPCCRNGCHFRLKACVCIGLSDHLLAIYATAISFENLLSLWLYTLQSSEGHSDENSKAECGPAWKLAGQGMVLASRV